MTGCLVAASNAPAGALVARTAFAGLVALTQMRFLEVEKRVGKPRKRLPG